jgi:hypothetical protein
LGRSLLRPWGPIREASHSRSCRRMPGRLADIARVSTADRPPVVASSDDERQCVRDRDGTGLRWPDHGRVFYRAVAALGTTRGRLASQILERDGGRSRPVHLRWRAGGSASVHRPGGAALPRGSAPIRRLTRWGIVPPPRSKNAAIRASRKPRLLVLPTPVAEAHAQAERLRAARVVLPRVIRNSRSGTERSRSLRASSPVATPGRHVAQSAAFSTIWPLWRPATAAALFT